MSSTTAVRRRRTGVLPVPAWAAVLVGGLTLLAALAGYGVEVYAESGTDCGALVQRRPGLDALCDEYFTRRQRLVVALTLVGAALLAVAPFASRRARGPDSSLDVTWGQSVGAAAVLSVFLPFSFLPFALAARVVADASLAVTSTGLPEGWKAVALTTGVITACVVMQAYGLTERSSLAALALAVPLVLGTQVLAAHPLAGSSLDSSARLPAAPAWLLASPVLFLVVVLVAVLQRRGWQGPAPMVGALTALAATAVVTVVLMPQLLPGSRAAQGGGPYPSGGLDIALWAPVLVVVGVAAVCLIAATSRRPPG